MTKKEAINIVSDDRYNMPYPFNTEGLERAMELYAISQRIQERKTIIYVLESDLADEEQEKIYSEDYKKCMRDEIENHNAFIADLENELEGLK
jgi:hypothetical protein